MMNRRTRDTFLWGMSVIYLFAFASLYVQIPGLYGDNGLLPARAVVGKEVNTLKDLLRGQPSLLRLLPKLGLDTQTAMDFLCLVGIVVSFLCMVMRLARNCFLFFLLWLLYLSLYQVGQTFLWFQWDILLLEVGFLTVLVAPLNFYLSVWKTFHHRHDAITFWLVKWLLFRLMFASGVVKLTSKCPTWWGLTALTYHFESQCIPTALAWYAHQLPVWSMKFGVVLTYVIEIAIPILFFSPVRHLRTFAFYTQILLQLGIIITGNYNFFNLLTMVLCISLLDDNFFLFRRKKGFTFRTVRKRSFWYVVFDIIFALAVYIFFSYKTVKLFNLHITTSYTIGSSLTFTYNDFMHMLETFVPYTILLGAVSLGIEVLAAIMGSFLEEKTYKKKLLSASQCMFFACVATGMFAISLVPYTEINQKAQSRLRLEIRRWHDNLDPFQITSSYGLFRMMTGVGGRPEVVIEGSNSIEAGWKEYHFLYKPGNLSARPPIVAPHQPRLDWQLWFAALGSYQHNVWFLSLAYRLLTGQPEVLQLIQHNPFPEKPPKFLRAKLYHYHYTSINISHRRYSKTDWWTRNFKSEYLPVITKDDTQFLEILSHYNIISSSRREDVVKKRADDNRLAQGVHKIRDLVGQPEGFLFCVSCFLTGLSVNIITVVF